MSFTSRFEKSWNESKDNGLLRQRLIEWRKGLTLVRLEKPTRLDRARRLGYKAKKGYLVVRVRVLRGGRQRPLFKSGRRSKTRRRLKIVSKSYQWVAEERVGRKFKNCEILNSYEIASDGKYAWYEVILLERDIVKNYPGMEWVAHSKDKVGRGLT